MVGMSHETTDKILRLAEKLSDKPALLNLLETGACGWSKLEKIAYIATPETDKEWAETIKTINTRALEAYIKELRRMENCGKNQEFCQNQTALLSNDNSKINRLEFTHVGEREDNPPLSQAAVLDASLMDESTSANANIQPSPWNRLSFPVSPEIEFKLKLFKQDLEKERRETLGWDEVMKELLKLAALGENQMKNKTQSALKMPKMQARKIIQICPSCVKKQENIKAEYGFTTRYTPIPVRQIVDERAGKKCEFPYCNNPSEIYHHTRRFALEQNHDPDFIKSLCKKHERLIHSGLVENEEMPPEKWTINTISAPTFLNSQKSKMDKRANAYRTEPP